MERVDGDAMRKMKESGIEWIGLIPSDWKIIRVKDKYNFDTGFTPDTTHPEYYEDEEGYEWATITDLNNGQVSSPTKSVIIREYVEITHRNPIPSGCLLYSFKLSVGQTAINDRPLYTNEAIASFYPKNINIDFLKYSSSLIEYGSNTNIYGARILNQQLIKDAYIVFPDEKEQELIANYLEKKCSELDALVADIQSELDTLEKYKRSKIFETVSHGLGHSRFAETDSDVWKTIPEKWKLVDIKYLFEIVKRIAGKEGYDVLSITQQGLKVKDISSNEGQIASDYSGYQFVYPNDYAMNHMDLLTGWVDLSDKFGVTSPDYRVFRLRNPKENDRKYYKYVMQCCYMCRIFYSLGQGVSNLGRWRLQTASFNNFKIPVPPYDEQVRIGEYLENSFTEIDKVITQKQEQLEVLADYKKSIIFEYVTGKKEVPSV